MKKTVFLTVREVDVLLYILEFFKTYADSPKLEDIGKQLNISRQRTYSIVKQLERKKVLRKKQGMYSRNIKLLKRNYEEIIKQSQENF